MKPVRSVTWDADNLRHLRERGRCSVQGVEDVLGARCHPTRRVPPARTMEGRQPLETRRTYHGQTCGGRYLVVIAADGPDGAVRPITCWPLAGRLRERYLAWRESLPR